MIKLCRGTLLFTVLLFTAPVPGSAMVQAGITQAQGIRTAAADETASGIALYQQGQNEEAIKILRDAAKRYNNLRAWHYLGLALEKKGDTNEARKAHEKAAKLGDKLVETELDRGSSEEFFSSLKAVVTELAEAGRSAQKYIELNPKLSRSKQEEWTARADSLLGFQEMVNGDPTTQTVFTPKQVDEKARILSKPEPTYTEDARRNQVTGRIVLRAILAANGRVTAIYPINTLPSGLTAQAIRAARAIRFIPAVKDGKPVSMAVQVEYYFNIY